MSDNENTSKAKGWTDAEKVALLFAIIESKGGGITWKDVTLPEGRTAKACMHVVTHMKQHAGGVKAGNPGGAGVTPRKRKAKGGDDNNDGGIAGFSPGKPSPKKKVMKEKKEKEAKDVKTENDDED